MVGMWLKVERRIDLVYGGGSVGLMGLVSQAVHHGGRHVLGFALSPSIYTYTVTHLYVCTYLLYDAFASSNFQVTHYSILIIVFETLDR